MGGRYGNNYRGRSKSRGRQKPGRGGRGDTRNSTNNHETREVKFAVMRNETATRYLTFAQVKKQLLRKMKMDKDLQEIGKAIENGQPWNHAAEKPARQESAIDIFDRVREPGEGGRMVTTKNPEKVEQKRVEQEGLDMDYKSEMGVWNERRKEYESGKITAYNSIMDEYCTSNIRGLVEQETDFESDIKDDPIKLLEALNRIAHEGATTGSYRCQTIITQLHRLVTLQMDDNELPPEWMYRVKAQCDSISQMMGNKWLTGVIANEDDYKNAPDQDAKDALVVTLWDELQAYIVLHGAHPKKYGQLKKDLKQFAVLNDEKYPKTMEDMKDALTRHPWDADWYDYKKQRQEQIRKSQ